MSRRAAGAILALALVVLAAGLTWWWLNDKGGRPWRRTPSAVTAQPREKVAFELYFPADGGRLRGERRELEVTGAPKDRVRAIVAALLAGPRQTGLARPLPEPVQLGSVQLVAGGTAYIDLRWAEQADPPAGGSTEEIQRLYSIVDSVAFNVPEVQGVVLLWNGTQRPTFSGHLDTSLPLLPDRGLLAGTAPAEQTERTAR